MFNIYYLLICISCLGVIVITVNNFLKQKKHTTLIINISIVTILLILMTFHYVDRTSLIAKGDDVNGFLLALMYAFMCLGIFSNYLYKRLSIDSDKRPPHDWGKFFAPLFLSPIVFIPFLTNLSTLVDLESSHNARIMLFFIAFENGFFWKSIADSQANKMVKNENK